MHRIQAFERQLSFGILTLLLLLGSARARAGDLPELIARIKPSVVGVGSFEALPKPKGDFSGTGFVVGDGSLVVTNAHVVKAVQDVNKAVAVFVPRGTKVEFRPAQVIVQEASRDIAVLRFDGPPLPPLEVGDSTQVREGTEVIVTGFPIGSVIGLFASTSRAIIAAITPIALPADSARELSTERIRALRDPFDVFQLDMISYPGHSGSPVVSVQSGVVIAILNASIVKSSKEDRLAKPSAIAYAIPARFIRDVLARVAPDTRSGSSAAGGLSR